MDSKIELDNLKVNVWEKGVVKAKVTDSDGNPVNGKAVVKVNHITRIEGRVVNGVFCEEHDFSDLADDEYDLYMIYGGTAICNPSDICVKLYLNHDIPVEASLYDIQNACYRLTKWIEVNKRLPGKISINKTNVGIGNLLYALALAIHNSNDNNAGDITITKYNPPKVSSENIGNEMVLSKEEYVELADQVMTYMDANQESPAFVEIDDKKMGFMNLVYTFAKIVCNSSSTGLISNVYVRPWKSIVAK